jgi:hypothetical protein
MIYLIGVDHLIQYNGPVPEPMRNEFRSYIIEICQMHGIQVIAEEFSNEALQKVYHATRETAGEAAEILKIRHRYCDPEEKELAEMGIPCYFDVMQEVKNKYTISSMFIVDDKLRKKVKKETADIIRSYWSIREEYWYKRISDIIGLPILFICGHEHVIRFRSLLIAKGHQCMIIDPFWKKDLFGDYGNFNLV